MNSREEAEHSTPARDNNVTGTIHDKARNEEISVPSSSEKRKFLKFFSRRDRVHNLRHYIASLLREPALLNKQSLHTPELSSPDLDRQERVLIMNVLRLREIVADDVMVPRADIVAMPDNISFEDALALMRQEHHSRMPVYHEQLDDIVGMIHVKDLIAHYSDSDHRDPTSLTPSPDSPSNPEREFCLTAILRQPLLIAPTIPVLDLLLQMRQRRTHMALVIDEYGSIDGLVTIEDLIETIVGDISDEHDDPVTDPWTERSDGSIDLDARLPVEELEERLGPVLTEAEHEAEIETVGGLVFRLAEHVPARGEVLTHPSGLEFRVLNADARHILALRIRLPPHWPGRPENRRKQPEPLTLEKKAFSSHTQGEDMPEDMKEDKTPLSPSSDPSSNARKM